MPIEEHFTVRPSEDAARLTGAEILELAERLGGFPAECAAEARVSVVTGWGGKIKRLEVVVPPPVGSWPPPERVEATVEPGLEGEVFSTPSADTRVLEPAAERGWLPGEDP
jgi:hypothetical protein